MIKQNRLFFAALLLFCSGCMQTTREETNAVIVSIDNENETIDILTDDYQNHTFTIDKELISTVDEGDVINFTCIGEEVKSIVVMDAQPTPQSVIDTIFTMDILKEHAVIDRETLISDYGLNDEQLKEGIAYLPTKQGDITEFVWLCGEDTAVEALLNNFKEGMVATYSNDTEKLSLINEAYMNVDNGIGILIIGDDNFKTTMFDELNDSNEALNIVINEAGKTVMEEGENAEIME